MGHAKKFDVVFRGMGSPQRILSGFMVDMIVEGHLSNGEWSVVGQRRKQRNQLGDY